MKKTLSLLLSVLMLVGLLAMPVSAGDNDGFNDGEFIWCQHENCQLPTCTQDGFCNTYEKVLPATGHAYDDDADATCNNCGEEREVGPVDPPVVPDEPVAGTKENPIYVAMGKSAPTSLNLKVGESIYYQLKAAVFNEYSILVYDMGAVITVDDVRYDADNAYSPFDYAIKVTLSFTPMSNGIVCFTNNGEEDMVDVTVGWEMPAGTETSPYMLESGENAISVPTSYPVYYTCYTPTALGEYVLSASDYENFMIKVDVDGDPATTEDQFSLTEDITYTCTESYIPMFFIVQPVGVTPDVTLTITPPAPGTENNPYWLSNYGEVMDGANFAGDAMWPASNDGVYYMVDGYTFNNTTMLVTGTAPLTVTVNGTPWTQDGTGQVTMEVPMELADADIFKVVIKSAGDVKLDFVFPEGTENNPKELNKGKNTLSLPADSVVYYATYTAEKDGVLLMKPNTTNGLGYTDAENLSSGAYDYIFIDPEGLNSSADNVLTIQVAAGDVVKITSCSILENDDFELLPLDVVLAIGYEGDLSITKEPATAAYAKEGAKVSVKITAKGDGLKYTWYIKNDGASKYTKSSITSATYSATMADKVHGRRIYCVVTDQYGNSVQSKTFMLRRQATITKEPATAAYAKKGLKAVVKITAKGDGLKYTWYVKNEGASKYSKSSITSATYSVTMASKVKGRRVYCVVTDKYGKSVQSKTFLLRESVSITTQPKTVTVKKNATAKVTVKASGDGLKYTWYVKNAGATKYSKSSITKSTYSVTMSSKVKNRLVYCVVTDKYGNTIKTTTVKLKMK